MNKDIQRLKIVSKLFTEKTLEDILRKATGDDNVKVTGWNFGDASAKGDSYLSTVDRVVVEGIVSGKQTTISLVVKSLPQNLGRRKTYRSTDFFYNEITFYSKIIPVFEKFLKSKNLNYLLRVPRCLSYVLDGENDFLVLEDVSVHGFGPVSRQSTLTLEECQLILTGMSRFHAVSFAYKDQNNAEFNKIAGYLRPTYYSESIWCWYKRFHAVLIRIAKDALSKEYGGTPEAQTFLNIDGNKLYNMSVEFCGRNKSPTSTITQGDAWAPNFLMRNTESNGEKEALLLDFQLACCASPVTDLSFFIYSCTDKSLRDKEFDNLLKFYHCELSSAISLLGSNPENIYSWNQFMHEVKEQFVHGLAFSFESIPFSVLEEDESFDLDMIKGDEAVDIADVWTLKPIEDQAKRKRLADVIMHGIKNGFLQ